MQAQMPTRPRRAKQENVTSGLTPAAALEIYAPMSIRRTRRTQGNAKAKAKRGKERKKRRPKAKAKVKVRVIPDMSGSLKPGTLMTPQGGGSGQSKKKVKARKAKAKAKMAKEKERARKEKTRVEAKAERAAEVAMLTAARHVADNGIKAHALEVTRVTTIILMKSAGLSLQEIAREETIAGSSIRPEQLQPFRHPL